MRDPGPPAEMVVADEEDRRLPGAIALYRSALALVRGDVAGTVRHARRALALALAEDHGVRAGAAGFLGLAYWTSGDLEAAHPAWADCAAGLSGGLADSSGCHRMADIRKARGRLGEAMSTYEQALQLATEHGEPVLRGAADMYFGISEVLASTTTSRPPHSSCSGARTRRASGCPEPYRWRVAMARIRQVRAIWAAPRSARRGGAPLG